jgi:hypothetical protein
MPRRQPHATTEERSFHIQEEAGQVVFHFPASRDYASGCGGFLFALVFGGVGLLAFLQNLSYYLAALAHPDAPGKHPGLGEVLAALPFLAVGVGIALFALDTLRRQTTITLTQEKLSIRWVGVFGVGCCEWPLDEVAEVYSAPCSGPKGQINRKLQVQTFDGRTRGFLRGRKHDEVECTEKRLRKELGMEPVKL